jgi:hypothetical protein
MWLQSIVTVNFAVNETTREVSLLFSYFSVADIRIVDRSAQSALIILHLVGKAENDLTLMLPLSSVIHCAACMISGSIFRELPRDNTDQEAGFRTLIFRLFTGQMAMIWTAYSLVSCIEFLVYSGFPVTTFM